MRVVRPEDGKIYQADAPVPVQVHTGRIRLRTQVDRREQRLRSAAGPAIIEINQQKTQEQVEQITGTPFFKELQSMSKRSQKQKKNE